MNIVSQGITVLGHALEVGLVVLLLRKKLWRTYPFFSFILVWINLRSISVPIVQDFFQGSYQVFYWRTETIELVLRFLVVWEVFRQTFPRGSALNKLITNGYAGMVVALSIFSVGAGWSYQTYTHFHAIYPALERGFGFAQAISVLAIVSAARLYGQQIGRNVWGMALGFGAWVSVATANNAMIDFAHSFLPYWQVLWRISFLGMLAMWTWAIWVYAPNPPITESDLAPNDPQVRAWMSDWDRATSAARKVVAP